MKRPHQKLAVWQEAVSLVESVYLITARFPSDEKFGLVSQLRRAAVSIPSNIAEGAARRSRKEYLKYLSIARGSLSELDTQLVIARRLRFAENDEVVDEAIDRLFAKITALMRALDRPEGEGQ
ncbi:MAG: four helix bundle protein [Nevskia sp.]|nr:four helix bundle protein [Nevskia sp.]